MTVRSSFHLRGRHLIPGWNDPNFLNSPPLCRRICQSWFYFCKDFPRDPRQARDHTGSWPDSKMFFLVLFLPKPDVGRLGDQNLGIYRPHLQLCKPHTQACCDHRNSFPRWRRSRAIRLCFAVTVSPIDRSLEELYWTGVPN